MQKDRLLKLADLLERDADNPRGIKFDMAVWGDVKDKSKPVSCGTSACAMGLAALSGEFKEFGLGYIVGSTDPDDGQPDTSMEVTMHGKGWGLSSAMELFGISEEEAEYLFLDQIGEVSEGAKGERAMAKIIREFVKNGLPGED